MVGVDQMAFFASYLRHLLALLDLRAEVVASASQEALARLARIDEDTLVIGFSQRPAACAGAACSQAGPQAGVLRTVAITDASLSELTKLADHCLYYSSNSPSYTRSHSGAAGPDPGARVRGLLERRGRLPGADPRLQAEVARPALGNTASHA